MSALKISSKKIAVVALSGGVDSSVVAYLLKQQQQYDRLVAVHMSNWEPRDEDDPYCTSERDWKDAQAVASHLHLPIHPTSFQSDYWTQVFEPFVAGVEQGRRPNPDVDCNRHIKFGALRDYVRDKWGEDAWLATGHYARLWQRNGQEDNDNNSNNELVEEMLQQGEEDNPNSLSWIRYWGKETNALSPLLLAARDRSKCQAFFLSSVSGQAFQNVMFPLGNLLKKKPTLPANNNKTDLNSTTVREIAQHANLPTAHKKDSMGICFIGKRPGGFNGFIHQYFGTAQQEDHRFVDIDTGQEVVANNNTNITGHNHSKSTHVYTVGQGAKIPGVRDPWFVTSTDPASHTIWVCAGTHHPALYTDVFYVRELQWVAGDLPTPLEKGAISTSHQSTITTAISLPVLLHAKCRIRNLQPLVDCRVTYEAPLYKIQTCKPLRAVTTGQHCALYVGADGLVCLGGGTILKRGPTYAELGMDMDLGQLHPAGHNDGSVMQQEK